MRKKNPEIMEKILNYTDEFHRKYRRSPSTTEIANEVGIGRGTAYTYLTAMRDRNMIEYDGKNITTQNSSRINHRNYSIPVVGRVVCGDPNEEEQDIRELIVLFQSFKNGLWCVPGMAHDSHFFVRLPFVLF